MSSDTTKPAISLAPPADPALRRAGRLLAMVHELHKAGYQRLRIASGMAPSGCHWRCYIVTADNVQANGWEPINWDDVASYSTGDEDRYFGWPDAHGKTARHLALMFLERYPDLCRRGEGKDLLYAGWFVGMLGAVEKEVLPVFFADHNLVPNTDEMPPPVRSISLDATGAEAVKTPGGVGVRIVAALNGFRGRFGYWPSVIEVEAGSIVDLATHSLTPLGFYLLQAKVKLVVGEPGRLLALGRAGDAYDYGADSWEELTASQQEAQVWLGWLPVEDT